MAKSRNNVVMRGASGKVGNMLVFRQKAGNTIIADVPKIDPDRVPTDGQRTVQERFADAAFYAKRAISDPNLKERYQQKAKPGQTAYNVAFKDYMTDPEIRRVLTDRYVGAIGDEITIRVRDVLEVKQVHVDIVNGNGEAIEDGFAVATDDTATEWVYTATASNEALNGSAVTVTLVNTPGNMSSTIVEL
ncbi:hypothetical protein [Olivibacter sp. XZL3]|uniref:hypothetical protein n=1 Tax=Olivibacter sp. XZL3 TaxID=1735116 RepID=UPI001064B5E0|nr:hypothetical protein [Olivibacter sp. XZL3]